MKATLIGKATRTLGFEMTHGYVRPYRAHGVGHYGQAISYGTEERAAEQAYEVAEALLQNQTCYCCDSRATGWAERIRPEDLEVVHVPACKRHAWTTSYDLVDSLADAGFGE